MVGLIKPCAYSQLKAHLQDFCIIDIRGKQAFLSAHLRNSYNADNEDEIIALLDSKESSRDFVRDFGVNNTFISPPPPVSKCSHFINKPLLILCFSSIKAKSFAQNLAQNPSFIRAYTHGSVYYLDCGIMEAYEAGLEVCEGSDGVLGQNLRQDNLLQSISQDSTQSQAPKATNPLVSQTIATLKEKYLANKKAWVVTFSGGKDSTCVLQLVYEMLVSLPSHLRRPTFAIASNTLVEAPHIDKFLYNVIDSINAHAKCNNIPFEVILVAPNLKDDFWVNLIGKGYPSPTRTFRWCTERLKINPAKVEIAKITRKFGSCILLLGSRKAESSNRKKSIEKRILNEDGYSKHHDFPDTLTYSPIAEWDTDAVWGYLLSHKPLWDKDHSELFALYSKASGDECQFITDLAQSSCGGSRFGCWVCTVVNEDKSMQGFISTGEAHLKPLNEFRNYIKELREDSNARADYKRDGRAVYKVGGLGPFLSKIRIEILERLLSIEREFMASGGGNLISDSQLQAIQEQWSKDFDLNDTAIKIAQKFHRLKGVKMEKSKILHKEILDLVIKDINDKYGQGTLDSEAMQNLITQSMNICNNAGSRGRHSAPAQIKAEVEKLLNDKTAKSQEA